MDATPALNLATLSDQPDYRVTAEDTDPRGWMVTDVNGVTLGTVTDLIIDLDGLVARYIVCALNGQLQRSVLLPVGFARVGDGIVHLDFITAAAIDQLPTYRGLPLAAEHESQIEKALTGITPGTSQPSKIIRRSSDARAAS